MKNFLYKTITITVLILTASCSKDGTETLSNFSLSENSLNFNKQKNAKSITIVTTDIGWDAVGSSQWIEINKTEGNKLSVSVTENKTTDTRKGWILVFAEGGRLKVNITQTGTAQSIEISKKNIEVDSDKGLVTVDVVTNDTDWKVTSTANWISITPKNYKYELDIEFTENTERTERTAKILVTVGGISKVISVKQSGILYYVLPSLEFSNDVIDIKNFEGSRKSDLMNESSSKWFKKLEFRTKSSLFSKILYEFNSKKAYETATIYASKTEFPSEKDNFIAFLKENGFEKDPNNENYYYNPEVSVQAEIDESNAKIIYTLVIKQDKKYETFTAFPFGFYKWFSTKEEVTDYESKNNGVLDKINSKTQENILQQVFTTNSSDKNSSYGRIYELSLVPKLGLHSTRQFFKKVNLGFYKGKDNKFHITKEFLDLVTSEGFKFLGTRNDGYHIFVNSSKKTNMLVRASIFPENNNVPELEIALLAKDR